MLPHRRVKKAIICCILSLCFQSNGRIFESTKDDTTSRANTLIDDADDIQRQLDNEVRDRIGQYKTVWVFHGPASTNFQYVTQTAPPTDIVVRLKRKQRLKARCQCKCGDNSTKNCSLDCKCGCQKSDEGKEVPTGKPIPEWHFWDQAKWHEKFKDCGGRAQSPIDLPVDGLIRTRGARKIVFSNYDVQADNLTVVNDGKRVVMYGHWPKKKRPLVYGGAAHSRRYLFHSLSVYWPSEHPVGGLYYPLETQLLHISSEYGSYDEAISASSKDPMAFLGIVNIYKYSNCSHPGLMTILENAIKCRADKLNIKARSLDYFSSPFNEYVCYYGSLTIPPCTESVLWLVRRRSLPVSRQIKIPLHQVLGTATTSYIPAGDMYAKMVTRAPQPLNDRKIFVFVQK